MSSPAHRSLPYQIVLTHLAIFSISGCVPPEHPPTPVVTVPIVESSASGLSAPPPRSSTARPPARLWTWERNAQNARDRARREHLPLVIYVCAEWSAGALSMDRNVWSDPRILFHPLAVVSLRIDLTAGPDAELWAEELHVQAVPSTIFIDADGREALRLKGERPIEDVLSALRRLEDDTAER